MASLFRAASTKNVGKGGKRNNSPPSRPNNDDLSPPGSMRDLSLRADVVGSLQRGKDRVLKVDDSHDLKGI